MVKQNIEKKFRSIKLFFLFPLYSRECYEGKTVWNILGLPILKKRRMENGITTKFYILGLPVMKLSRKTVKC